MTDNGPLIYPVVMAVPAADRRLRGRDKVAALSRHARTALVHAARRANLVLGALDKNDRGAPLPSNGVFWSLSHKIGWVAAVAAPVAVGIDIETVRPYRAGLEQRIADEYEWQLAGQIDKRLFFRYWTAKEAVLKAIGVGITGLSRCRITAIVDSERLRIEYDTTAWAVHHHGVADDHLAAVAIRCGRPVWQCIDNGNGNGKP